MFNWILVIFFSMEWTEGQAIRAYFTESKFNWEQAKQKCKMIGSETTVNVSQSTITIGWIDAVATYTPWVEYLGCFDIKEKQISNQITVDSGKELLQCLSYCNEYSYIGLKNSRCACLFNTSMHSGDLDSACHSTVCSGDLNVVCPTENSPYRFVMYAKVPINRSDGIGNCLAISQRDRLKSFSARLCDERLYQICSLDTSHTKFAQDSKKLNWSKSFGQCQHGRNGLAPYSLVTRSDFQIANNLQYWIGVMRRPIVSFLPSNDLGSYTYCLSAEVGIGGQIKTKIQYCRDELPALCTMAETTDMPILTSGLHTEGNESSETKETLIITLIVTSLVTFAVIMIIVVLLVRFRNRRRLNQQVPIASKEVVYAKVNKPPKSDKKENKNSDTGSLDIYDHMNQNPNEDMIYATENNYDTMQSIENETDNIYNHTNEGEISCVICDDEEYSQAHLY